MDSLTVITVFVVVGLTEARNVIAKKPMTMKPVIAGFILGILLFIFDGINLKVSRSFAILIMVGALIYNASTLATLLGTQLPNPNVQRSQQGSPFRRAI